ncbi:hypothetical protein ABMA28_007701 [Loxostege sticticalis]|uniref:rRNA adenine N(6)-methyltransferase n=1 Tax=Loxostege sticticalis TaxID=481309 RepID=A0ABD0SIH2_LOXSC
MISIKFRKLSEISRISGQIFTIRLRHKLNKKTNEKDLKLATDVVNYLENSEEYRDVKDKLPNSLLRKYKTPESMYLINRKTAKYIAKTVTSHINEESAVVEVNPGLGFLSEELLHCMSNHIYMYETSNHFSPHLNSLLNKHPGRVTYKIADFFGMWKLAFKDKMDNGNRIQELLGSLSTNDNSRTVKIIGSMPGLTFIKHLLNNIIFHTTNNQLGRTDLFITMPGHHYELEESRLYLVNITQKEELPCPSEYLPLLWYFFKPHMFSKSTRVIPMLEQWIPGCGVWLISGQDPPDTNKTIAPGKDDAELPHMTIFTEFGDLTLKQKITIFKRFVSWPEFDQCPFKVTMENNLPKFVLNLEDEDKDNIGTHIDDITDHSDAEIET